MEPHTNSANVKKRMDSMVSKLREHDFRITPQRLAVLRVLAASEGHPSVERIYETVRQGFPTTSIATIYKTVNSHSTLCFAPVACSPPRTWL